MTGKTPIEIANEIIDGGYADNNRQHILAEGFLEQERHIKKLEAALLQKAMTTFSGLQEANDLQGEALKEAKDLMELFPWRKEDPACFRMEKWLKKYSSLVERQ